VADTPRMLKLDEVCYNNTVQGVAYLVLGTQADISDVRRYLRATPLSLTPGWPKSVGSSSLKKTRMNLIDSLAVQLELLRWSVSMLRRVMMQSWTTLSLSWWAASIPVTSYSSGVCSSQQSTLRSRRSSTERS
jgi:hypothetical protein